MRAFLQSFVQRLFAREQSPARLTYSIVLGIYLAFSPFLGFQTPLAFILGWALSLNVIVVNIVLYAVNNPWSLVPILVLDYLSGRFIVQTLFGLDLTPYNPRFIDWIWAKIGPYLSPYIGDQAFCFWSYIIGGNIVALGVALVCYPFLKRFITSQMKQHSTKRQNRRPARV